jgi:hypothetical protein
MRRSRSFAVGTALLLSLALPGCGSDSDDSAAPSEPTVSTAPAVCADSAAAQAALQKVDDVSIVKDGTTAFKTELAAFEASVQTLIESARVDFAPEADAVRSAVDDLKVAVDALGADPGVTKVAAVAAALTPVQDSVDTLTTRIKTAC